MSNSLCVVLFPNHSLAFTITHVSYHAEFGDIFDAANYWIFPCHLMPVKGTFPGNQSQYKL